MICGLVSVREWLPNAGKKHKGLPNRGGRLIQVKEYSVCMSKKSRL